MTREEQIRQASIEYTYRNTPMCIGGGAFSEMADELNRNKSFEEGAKWADATMIEKAYNWLDKHAEEYTIDGGLAIECLLHRFKQDMKNE